MILVEKTCLYVNLFFISSYRFTKWERMQIVELIKNALVRNNGFEQVWQSYGNQICDRIMCKQNPRIFCDVFQSTMFTKI